MKRKSVIKKIFRFFCSLKLAISTMIFITLALIAATFLESAYDTPTAQFWIYKSRLFYFLLTLLGIEIFCVAMSRYPWKKNHIPFLTAHAGILILLLGSWVTQRYGVDGSLRIGEGNASNVVEIDDNVLSIVDADGHSYSVSVPWHPSMAAFSPIHVKTKNIPVALIIDQFITHAEPKVSFVPSHSVSASKLSEGEPRSALHFKLTGGPMRATQDFWLWTGDPSWKAIQAGPARFFLGTRPGKDIAGPWLSFLPNSDQSIQYVAQSSDGKTTTGKLGSPGTSFEPGWKGGVKIEFLEWIAHAENLTRYTASKYQLGAAAPYSAIHLATRSNQQTEIWMGLGDRAQFEFEGKRYDLAYMPRRLVLPFSVQLEHFTVDHYEGTQNPSAFSSRVSVIDQTNRAEASEPVKDVTISMNEPLKYRGITFYQASYEEAMPRPTISILSVNDDPGRWMKYIGSLLIVLGCILLVLSRYRKRPSQSGERK